MNATIERGMVLGVSRGLYEHYGVYVGRDEIIHYTSLDDDVSAGASIMRTSMRHFIRDASEFFVLKFPDHYETSKGATLRRGLLLGVGLPFMMSAVDAQLSESYHLYSREECAWRAESRVGEGGYNLVLNNCEHFAIWSKTGLEISIQTNRLFDAGIEISRWLPARGYIAR